MVGDSSHQFWVRSSVSKGIERLSLRALLSLDISWAVLYHQLLCQILSWVLLSFEIIFTHFVFSFAVLSLVRAF